MLLTRLWEQYPNTCIFPTDLGWEAQSWVKRLLIWLFPVLHYLNLPSAVLLERFVPNCKAHLQLQSAINEIMVTLLAPNLHLPSARAVKGCSKLQKLKKPC